VRAASSTVHGPGAITPRHRWPADHTARAVPAVVSFAVPVLFTTRYPVIARFRHANANGAGGRRRDHDHEAERPYAALRSEA
jgi:hypothetical protein